MLGTFSFNSVSSRARAAIGRLRGAITRRAGVDDYEDDQSYEAGASLNRDEFDVQTVETADDHKVSIFVAKPSEPAYFDEKEEYAPTIVGAIKQEEVEAVVEPVKKERFVAAEPADLFINALRRPVRQRFDTSVPNIKKKAAVAPAVEETPVIKAEVTEVEQIVTTFEKVEVEEEILIADAEEIVTISEPAEPVEVTVTAVMEAPVAEKETVPSIDDALLESLESDEDLIECSIAHDSSAVESEAITVEEAEPIVSATVVVPAMPRKIEIAPLEVVEQEIVSTGSVEPMVAACTSAEAIEAPIVSTPSVEVCEIPEVIKIEDESSVLLAFRPELSQDCEEFVTTSFDDNLAFREDYLDETERTFKIRASSVTAPAYRFDGNFRSLSRF